MEATWGLRGRSLAYSALGFPPLEDAVTAIADVLKALAPAASGELTWESDARRPSTADLRGAFLNLVKPSPVDERREGIQDR